MSFFRSTCGPRKAKAFLLLHKAKSDTGRHLKISQFYQVTFSGNWSKLLHEKEKAGEGKRREIKRMPHHHHVFPPYSRLPVEPSVKSCLYLHASLFKAEIRLWESLSGVVFMSEWWKTKYSSTVGPLRLPHAFSKNFDSRFTFLTSKHSSNFLF